MNLNCPKPGCGQPLKPMYEKSRFLRREEEYFCEACGLTWHIEAVGVLAAAPDDSIELAKADFRYQKAE